MIEDLLSWGDAIVSYASLKAWLLQFQNPEASSRLLTMVLSYSAMLAGVASFFRSSLPRGSWARTAGVLSAGLLVWSVSGAELPLLVIAMPVLLAIAARLGAAVGSLSGGAAREIGSNEQFAAQSVRLRARERPRPLPAGSVSGEYRRVILFWARQPLVVRALTLVPLSTWSKLVFPFLALFALGGPQLSSFYIVVLLGLAGWALLAWMHAVRKSLDSLGLLQGTELDQQQLELRGYLASPAGTAAS